MAVASDKSEKNMDNLCLCERTTKMHSVHSLLVPSNGKKACLEINVFFKKM